MHYWEHGEEKWVRERERERERPGSTRAAQPHTVGYVGGRGEEEGGVKHEDSVAANSLVCFDKAKTEHGTSDAGHEKKYY